MKILIATDTYYPSVNGASYFTQRLAAGLAGRGHEVSVLAPGEHFGRDTVSTKDGVTIYGIRSISFPVYPNLRLSPLFLARRAIHRHIEEIQPDVVHVQNHFMIGKGAVLSSRALDIPVVGTNHFMPENLAHYFHLPVFAERWLLEFGWWQFARIFRQLDAITTPTRTAARLIDRLDLGKEIQAISCGIDLARFSPTNDGEYLRQRYSIPSERSVVLYVGRLDKEKRIETVLQALPDIARTIDVHLVLAGVGTLRDKLEALVKKLNMTDRVTFAGFVANEDLPNLYRIADLFVNAGIAELQSIVTMEALASGLPVLAVRAMALPELVHDGVNGYLFTDGDSAELAEKATRILSDGDLRRAMSQASLAIIKAHDINKSFEHYEAMYRTSGATENRLSHSRHSKKHKTTTAKMGIARVAGTAILSVCIAIASVFVAVGYQQTASLNQSFKYLARTTYAELFTDEGSGAQKQAAGYSFAAWFRD